MFPNPQNSPALSTKLARYTAVTYAISADLYFPKVTVLNRCIEVFRASMPEAAVSEYRDLLFGKNKIWAADHGPMPPPTRELVLPKKRRQRQFSVLVATATDPGHHCAALLSCKNIAHVTATYF
jgi:hypothetical protein